MGNVLSDEQPQPITHDLLLQATNNHQDTTHSSYAIKSSQKFHDENSIPCRQQDDEDTTNTKSKIGKDLHQHLTKQQNNERDSRDVVLFTDEISDGSSKVSLSVDRRSRIWDGKWQQRYKELKDFHKQYRHCNVPKGSTAYKPLAAWVRRQRSLYKSSSISPERLKQLEKVGFEWNCLNIVKMKNDKTWLQWYKDLVKFKKQYGHCNVSQYSEQYAKLAQWVSKQRADYKHYMTQDKRGQMTKERLEKLTKLGFEWNTSNSAMVSKAGKSDSIRMSYRASSGWKANGRWLKKYKELKEFQKQHGHCIVPYNNKSIRQLARWVASQRYVYKKGKLATERIEKLEKLGFEWVRWSEAPLASKVKDELKKDTPESHPYDLVVGCQLSVHWPDDGKNYKCVIISKEDDTLFTLLYDSDRATEKVDLRHEQYKVLSWPGNYSTRKRKILENRGTYREERNDDYSDEDYENESEDEDEDYFD